MTKIYVVRHGRTYLNKYHRLQGWSDAPLIPEGVEGAHVMGQALADYDFDLAASSDLKRASDTRQIIVSENKHADQIKSLQLPELREIFFGYFEAYHDTAGMKEAFKTDKYPRLIDALNDGYSWSRAADTFHAADPEGDAETGEAFESRLKAGVEKLAATGAENILLVGHACMIHCIASMFGTDKVGKELPKHNQLMILDVTDGKVTVEEFGREMY